MDNQTIYFISSHHERSLIAEGWASRLKAENITFRSAGWFDAKTNPFSIEAMKEISIDLSSFKPHQIDLEELDQADMIVLIQDFDRDDKIHLTPSSAKKIVTWNIINPEKRSADPTEKWLLFQEICDDIADRIKDLGQTLSSPV
ncbi:low molecular weight phosphatase family protein [Jeotgalibacillus proteolyticus]|uniref:Phosphatase n=1 Tax=Jeotgalibacillus proteolyticus TaxID=2082395 RepID=A0A2S5GHH4_9BACL|nr:phosphatase [Jeotgalibacillus proteolyticus]PPA72436.1 phosphatase [Jeotgalibacillus proteolyticus]